MLRMAANIALDYVVGVIPFFGDAFDVVWKANQKNVALLKRHVLATPAQERRARMGDWFVLAGLVAALVLVLIGAFSVAVWIWTALFHWAFG
jgi:cytochrome c-type biogenesis protein CcmH/NrfG